MQKCRMAKTEQIEGGRTRRDWATWRASLDPYLCQTEAGGGQEVSESSCFSRPGKVTPPDPFSLQETLSRLSLALHRSPRLPREPAAAIQSTRLRSSPL